MGGFDFRLLFSWVVCVFTHGVVGWCGVFVSGGLGTVRGVRKLVSTPFAPFCRGKRMGCRPVRTCYRLLIEGKLRNMFVGNSSKRNCVLARSRHVGLTRH